MLTKVGDPPCLKTEVGGKQEYALCKTKSSKNYRIKKFLEELASSPQQLLNGQEALRISREQKFEMRFGSFCGRGKK